MDLKFFQCAGWKRDKEYPFSGSGFWFRFFGYGLHFTNSEMLFSERTGFEKRLNLPFGWRVKFLRKEKW